MLKSAQFLMVDYLPKESYLCEQPGRPDFIYFLFYVNNLKQCDEIAIDNKEIVDFKWVTMLEAKTMLDSRLAKRLEPAMRALKNKMPEYLECGEPLANMEL